MSTSSIMFGNNDNFEEPISVFPYPRIVMIGNKGTGLTKLANVLAGCLPDDNSCYKTCTVGDSCSSDTTVNVVSYLGNSSYGNFTIVNNPGFGEGDGLIIDNMINVLKHTLSRVFKA